MVILEARESHRKTDTQTDREFLRCTEILSDLIIKSKMQRPVKMDLIRIKLNILEGLLWSQSCVLEIRLNMKRLIDLIQE